MLKDANLVIQAAVTHTADANTAAFDLKAVSGSGLRSKGPLYAEILYNSASDAQVPPASTARFDIEHSDDGNTWFTHVSGADQLVNLPAAAVSGEIFLPISTDKRYIRIKLDITAGDGNSTPTITWRAYLGTGLP